MRLAREGIGRDPVRITPDSGSRMNIADLRMSYERDELDESASATDPLVQFGHWMEQALNADLPEPNAMTLATVGADGRPSTRVVLIKGFDARGIVSFTNYQSRKGQELAHQPYAALQFHWVELQRVVRIEGPVTMVSEAESDASRLSSAGFASGRLGVAAKPGHSLAQRSGRECRQGGRSLRPASAKTTALGWLSPAA